MPGPAHELQAPQAGLLYSAVRMLSSITVAPPGSLTQGGRSTGPSNICRTRARASWPWLSGTPWALRQMTAGGDGCRPLPFPLTLWWAAQAQGHRLLTLKTPPILCPPSQWLVTRVDCGTRCCPEGVRYSLRLEAHQGGWEGHELWVPQDYGFESQ